MATLHSALEMALAGATSVVVVGGEAGSGKSRLLDEFGQVARRRDVEVLTGRAWEAGGSPAFWLWREALRPLLRDTAPRDLALLLGDVATAPDRATADPGEASASWAESEGDRFRFFDAMTTFLERASARHPMVVLLDDVHVADEPSRVLLRFVANHLRVARLLVVATYRDTGVDAAATGELVADLLRGSASTLVSLAGLDRDDVGRLMSAAAPAAASDDVVREVYRDTGGNPLFVSELTRLVAEEGVGARLASAPSVRAVIARRLERVPEDAVAALEVASAIGQEFDVGLLAAVTSKPVPEMLDVLVPATSARLVESGRAGSASLRFSHGIVRDVLYEALAPSRRIELHRRIGLTLETMPGGDADARLAQVAHHALRAAPGGDADRAVAVAVRAGEAAVKRYGYEDAARLFASALEVVEAIGSEQRELQCDVQLLLGDALARSGDLAAAKQSFRTAASIAGNADLTQHLARAALGYGGRWTWSRAADDVHLVPMLERALSALGSGDSVERVRLLGRLAGALRSHPDREIGGRLASDAVAMAERLADPVAIAYAYDAELGARYWYDNPAERLDLADAYEPTIRAARDPERLLNLHLCRVSALLELCRTREAESELQRMRALADEVRLPAYQWMVVSIEAMLLMMRGALERADVLLEAELSVGSEAITAEAGTAHAIHLIWRAQMRGELEGLDQQLQDGHARAWWYPMFRCLLAEWYAEVGNHRAAQALLDELAADDFRALLPRDNEWLLSASILADVCVALDDRARAGWLYTQLEPVADLHAIGVSEMARGSTRRSLGALAGVLGRFDDAVAHLERAIESNRAMGAKPWVIRSRVDLARVASARDSPGDADLLREQLALATEEAASLGLQALIRSAPHSVPSDQATLAASRATLRPDGDVWLIAFGSDEFRMRATRGLEHLAKLVVRPGQEMHALALVSTTADSGSGGQEDLAVDDGRGLEVLDARARAAYRARVVDLVEEIDEATTWNDLARVEQLRSELDFIERELAGATGLRGRERRTGSNAERARLNVTRAIKSTIERIAAHSPALAAHFRATVRTGNYCSYQPDPRAPIEWDT